jgi:hypothetical protein
MTATSNILISISSREREIRQLVSTGLSSSDQLALQNLLTSLAYHEKSGDHIRKADI